MKISTHISGSIITEHLTFFHVTGRSMGISAHMSGSVKKFKKTFLQFLKLN